MTMDADRTLAGGSKRRVSSLYAAIVGLLVLANVIAGIGLIARAFSNDDATSVSAEAGEGVALEVNDDGPDEDTPDETAGLDDADADEAGLDDALDDAGLDDGLDDVGPSGVAMVDDAPAEVESSVPLEPGIDPEAVLESVEFLSSEPGSDGAAITIDPAALWTGEPLPTEGFVRVQDVIQPEPIAEIGSKYSADWQIHSLTTGELVDSTFERFTDGQLPVFELGDGQLPFLVEDGMLDNSIESDYLAVYPLGMDDLPATLDPNDAYVAFVQIYGYSGPDTDDGDLGTGADTDTDDGDLGTGADTDTDTRRRR